MKPQKPRDRYLEEYYKNEYDSNRNMAFANLFLATLLFILWILYITNVLPVYLNLRIVIDIILPLNVFILVSPLFYLKTSHIKKPKFKDFLLFSFTLVIGLLNILLPKHTMILWALPIIMTNHYYNPKLGRVIFITVVMYMLFCLYAGMFLGEYDPTLLGPGIIVNDQIVFPDTPKERWEMVIDLMHNGDNRFLKVLGFSYIPRLLAVSLIFIVSDSLNKRTYKLLINEIKVNSDQQKMSTELEVAKSIQLATLPNEIITSKDIRIIAELRAAKEVGGDFYDYFNIDEDHLGIVIGDVSGKGIPAAMFMMKTITCFKNFVRADKTPSQILKEVNKSIYEGNESQMFVTCFLGILNKRTGELKYANAGHNPPVIGDNRNFHFLKCNPGFILGVLEDAMVIDESVMMKNGESITLYTDGITEARSESGELFGEKRLIDFFNSKDFYSLVEMHHGIKDQLANFVQNAEQSDDITMATLMYHGDDYVSIEKRFDAKLDQISEMLNTLEKFCDTAKMPMDFKANLLVVGDEIFSNIVNHGYNNEGGIIFLRLLYNNNKKEFVLTVIDRAKPFNQLEVNNSALEGKAEDQKIGGLGILIVKSIMSECAYDRINNKNILVLRKKF